MHVQLGNIKMEQESSIYLYIQFKLFILNNSSVISLPSNTVYLHGLLFIDVIFGFSQEPGLSKRVSLYSYFMRILSIHLSKYNRPDAATRINRTQF